MYIWPPDNYLPIKHPILFERLREIDLVMYYLLVEIYYPGQLIDNVVIEPQEGQPWWDIWNLLRDGE